MSEKYIYGAWENISNSYDKIYVRRCLKNDIKSMRCIIEYKDNFWQAEIPRTLDIPNFNGEKHFFIKDISYFNEISEAILWVDIEMDKISFFEIKKPFIFNWY